MLTCFYMCVPGLLLEGHTSHVLECIQSTWRFGSHAVFIVVGLVQGLGGGISKLPGYAETESLSYTGQEGPVG